MPEFCEGPGRFAINRKTSDFRRRPGTPWRDEISGGDVNTRGSAAVTSAGSPLPAIRLRAPLRRVDRGPGGPCGPFAGQRRGGYDGRDPRRPHPRYATRPSFSGSRARPCGSEWASRSLIDGPGQAGAIAGRPAHDHWRTRPSSGRIHPLFACDDCSFVEDCRPERF